MRNIRNILCLILALAICFSFVGCAEESDSGKTKVTIWSVNSGSKAIMTKLVADYNATVGEEKGIEIEYIVKDGDYGQQLDLALQSNVGPDIFENANVEKYVPQGYMVAFEDIEGGIEYLDRYKNFAFTRTHKYDGKIYTVPKSTTTYGIVYNKEMFVEAGIVDENGEALPPKTFDELREYAKKLTDKKNNKYGIVMPLKWNNWIISDVLIPAFTISGMFNGYNPAEGVFDYSGTIPVMKCILEMKNDKSIFPGAELLDNDPARARFAEGNIGMKFSASYDASVFNNQFPTDFEWGVAPLPVIDKPIYKQEMDVGTAGAINAQESTMKKIDKVFEVYKWFTSDELALQCYQEGIALPWDASIIEGVELENEINGWQDFADLIKISADRGPRMKLDMTGQRTIRQLYVEDLWSDAVDVEEGINNWTKISNNAAELYQQKHPEYDPSVDIVPNWFEIVKR